MIDRDNFNQDSTCQAGHVTSKERITGEHRELQAAKRGALAGTGSGRARQSPTTAERAGRAARAEAPPSPGRTPVVGARRASAAASEDPEAAAEGGPRRDTPVPVLRASEGRSWRGAVDSLPERVRITDAAPGKGGPGEGGGDTEDTDPRD